MIIQQYVACFIERFYNIFLVENKIKNIFSQNTQNKQCLIVIFIDLSSILILFSDNRLFEWVQHEKLLKNFCLTRFSEFSGQEHLVDDGVDLVKVEHQVKLTHVVEVLVQDLKNNNILVFLNKIIYLSQFRYNILAIE